MKKKKILITGGVLCVIAVVILTIILIVVVKKEDVGLTPTIAGAEYNENYDYNKLMMNINGTQQVVETEDGYYSSVGGGYYILLIKNLERQLLFVICQIAITKITKLVQDTSTQMSYIFMMENFIIVVLMREQDMFGLLI